MKVIVAVCVYNRFSNLEHWLNCWKECNKENAELVVIHTGEEIEKFQNLCKEVTYIHRQNIGFDIGCFQDICRERLAGFPDFDYLLWCSDDTVPMTKDFIKPFIDKLQIPNVGLSCMQISKSNPGGIIHVRTTGFCLSKEVSKRLTFPADPVKTKQDCYLFEHRAKNQILSEQIRAMGLDVVQVAPNATSPLFDTGFWKRLNRQAEHDAVFPSKKKGDKVVFICTIYNTYPQIISSLLLQTHKNWKLFLIHDGPSSNGMLSYIPNDPRITYLETTERTGNYGHRLRQRALNEFELSDFTVITNADNYYTPVFIEYMLKGFHKSHTVVATYSEKMTHSYKAWDVIPCKLERGYLDCGGVMIKSDIAKEVGWREITEHSADWIFFSDIAAKYSWKNFIPVKGNLFVHN